MPYSKKALRNMPPHTRRVARILNQLESSHRRLRNTIPHLIQEELWTSADAKQRAALEIQETLNE